MREREDCWQDSSVSGTSSIRVGIQNESERSLVADWKEASFYLFRIKTNYIFKHNPNVASTLGGRRMVIKLPEKQMSCVLCSVEVCREQNELAREQMSFSLVVQQKKWWANRWIRTAIPEILKFGNGKPNQTTLEFIGTYLSFSPCILLHSVPLSACF